METHQQVQRKKRFLCVSEDGIDPWCFLAAGWTQQGKTDKEENKY